MPSRRISLALSIALMTSSASAHNHDHPELADWYKSLTSKIGPCCDGSDAKSLEDPEWRVREGAYEVFLEGNWVKVPEDSVLGGANRDGRVLVWPYYQNGRAAVRCFMPGALT